MSRRPGGGRGGGGGGGGGGGSTKTGLLGTTTKDMGEGGGGEDPGIFSRDLMKTLLDYLPTITGNLIGGIGNTQLPGYPCS